MLVTVPIAEVYAAPARKTVTDELLYGAEVSALGRAQGEFLEVQTETGHRGFVESASLWDVPRPDREMELSRESAVLEEARIAAPRLLILPRFSRVSVIGQAGDFSAVRLLDGRLGYVLRAHLLAPHSRPQTPDAVCDVALSLLDVPYLWGGRSARGVDCSGLASLAFGACGVILPRDTDGMHTLPEVGSQEARRGDLILFPGHVGLFVNESVYVHAALYPGFVSLASRDLTHPLYDARHVPAGYTVRRVLG